MKSARRGGCGGALKPRLRRMRPLANLRFDRLQLLDHRALLQVRLQLVVRRPGAFLLMRLPLAVQIRTLLAMGLVLGVDVRALFQVRLELVVGRAGLEM